MANLKPGDLTHYLASTSPAERELKRLFLRLERLTILDVGACEGEESIRYARAFPRARIFSFEPLPANRALITANFARHGVSSAEIIDIALSDQDGESAFHVSSGRPPSQFAGENWNYGNKSSSLLPPKDSAPMFGWVAFKETIAVRTQRLDAFAAERGLRRVDFIHMDVQGAEYLVLSGGRQTLRHTLAVWLEVAETQLYRGQRVRKDIEEFMAAQGFALTMELRRGIEGDQFYVNTRYLRLWPYFCARRAVNAWRLARQPGKSAR